MLPFTFLHVELLVSLPGAHLCLPVCPLLFTITEMKIQLTLLFGCCLGAPL